MAAATPHVAWVNPFGQIQWINVKIKYTSPQVFVRKPMYVML